MINDILQSIGAYIATQNPTYNTYYTGAIQLQGGQVVKFINGEGQYQGLSDTNSNYFYLRYAGDIIASDVNEFEQITSCNEQKYTAPARLVSWVNGGDTDKIIKALSFDLSKYAGPDLPYYSIDAISINKITQEAEKVYTQETKDKEPQIPHRVSLIAIDFKVTFRTFYKSGCVDRDFCETVC